MYTEIHLNRHQNLHKYTCECTHISPFTESGTSLTTHTHKGMRTCTHHAHTHRRMYTQIYIHAHTHTWMYPHIYVNTHTHKWLHTQVTESSTSLTTDNECPSSCREKARRWLCDRTSSCVRRDSFWHMWHDSFICVTWLIHMCDMTHSYVW